MTDLVYRLLQGASFPVISETCVNDVEMEGEHLVDSDDNVVETMESHIILTLDTPEGYRVIRLDVTDLGEDHLEHK